MYVQVGGSEWEKIIPLFFVTLVCLCLVMIAVYFFLKKKDNSQPLVSKKVKILEKPVQQANVEWYVVECEDGDRIMTVLLLCIQLLFLLILSLPLEIWSILEIVFQQGFGIVGVGKW